MKKKFEGKRWLISGSIIAAVILFCVLLTLVTHKEQGSLRIQAVSDGSNGAIIAWQEQDGIYVQRVDSSGGLPWGKGGTKAADVQHPDPYNNQYIGYSLVADGAGGAFLTWAADYTRPDNSEDPATYQPVDIFTQRISPSGDLLWGKGVVTGHIGRMVISRLPQVIPDGSGGCLYAWNDFNIIIRGLYDSALRVQKLDGDGRALWGDKGILVVTSNAFHPLTEEEKAKGIKGTYTRDYPTFSGQYTIIDDGSGGAFVFWQVDGAKSDNSIAAQHIDAGGNLTWPASINAGTGDLQYAFGDGLGGAIFCYLRQNRAVFVQKIGIDGELRWGMNGITGAEYISNIVSDGQGGAYLVMQSTEVIPDAQKIGTTSKTKFFLQRVDGGGKALWDDPVECSGGINLVNLQLGVAADGLGGAYPVFREGLHGYSIGGELLCRRVSAGGALLWIERGVSVFSGASVRFTSQPLTMGDGVGGVIIAAAVGKNPLQGDMVYAQRLDQDGNRLWGDGIRVDR